MIRLSVDIGGTFTDIVLDIHGHIHCHKILSTPDHPEHGALAGIEELMRSHEVELCQVQSLIHGTTLATNALIERRGARTALVTTQGFRDVLEMRNEKRFDQYALNIQLPEPLVPRERRFTVDERMLADGTVAKVPDSNQIQRLVHQIVQHEVEAVAIGFLHAYQNPENEYWIAQQLRAALDPGISICLSCEVANEIREFERFSTVCANAYVRPLMARYLKSFHNALMNQGFTGAFLLMLSGGGVTTLEQALRTPIRLVESGPAGGALLAAHISTVVQSKQTVALDIGGTTAKICFIENHQSQTTRRFEVARAWKNVKGSGLPIRVPTIELIEIGAGGGSIAQADSLQRLAVGPESAGSDPGPCAYALGGTRATVTDAHIVIGNIDTDDFAGGAIALEPSLARQCIHNDIVKPLNLATTEAAAAGVVEVADELMANAARVHGIELGKNIADCDLLVSGGGGALHATRIAEKLGIYRVIVPRNAGVGSAVGFLHSPVSFETAITLIQAITEVDYSTLSRRMADVQDAVRSIVASATIGHTRIEERITAELRYRGQDLVSRLDLHPNQPLEHVLPALHQRFIEDYQCKHGFTIPGVPVELVSLSVNAIAVGNQSTDTQATDIQGTYAKATDIQANRQTIRADESVRAVYDIEQDGWKEYAVLPRVALHPHTAVKGPAIITEAQTTTLVRENWSAAAHDTGHLILTYQAPQPHA